MELGRKAEGMEVQWSCNGVQGWCLFRWHCSVLRALFDSQHVRYLVLQWGTSMVSVQMALSSVEETVFDHLHVRYNSV